MPTNPPEYMLQTESVIKQYKQYDTVITAVNRASIKVEPGEFVAIIGTSGSGKSTFLHICAGLDSCDAGRVLIRGNDITKMSADELSRFRGINMGFVFQRHNLIPQFTALENILIPTMMCNKPELSYQETLRRLVETLQLTERPPSLRAVRRSAAARRHRPRDDQYARHPLRRRTDRQPRPRQRGRSAETPSQDP